MPLFCRLSIFPYFFGSTPDTFPVLEGLEDSPAMESILSPSPAAPPDIGQLQYSLDVLVCRATRLVRTGDRYARKKKPQPPVPDEVLAEQRQLEELLARWERSFSAFKAGRTPTSGGSPSPSDDDRTLCVILEMKHINAVIWVNMALEPDEVAYDRHLDRFRTSVDLAWQEVLLLLSSGGGPAAKAARSQPRFLFEMGFLPLLYFVVIKCRCLHTRTRALQAMRALAATRENLWDVDVMYAVARQVIETEHGVRVRDVLPQLLQPEQSDGAGLGSTTATDVSLLLRDSAHHDRIVDMYVEFSDQSETVDSDEGEDSSEDEDEEEPPASDGGPCRKVAFIVRDGDDGELKILQERVRIIPRNRQ